MRELPLSGPVSNLTVPHRSNTDLSIDQVHLPDHWRLSHGDRQRNWRHPPSNHRRDRLPL